jgi:hypothetical protein
MAFFCPTIGVHFRLNDDKLDDNLRTEKLATINPFVKAFYIVLLSEMADLSLDEFSREIDQLKIFSDRDPRVRAFMAKALADLGEKAIGTAPILLTALNDKDIEVRTNAIQAMGNLGASAKIGVEKIGEQLLYELDEDLANPKRMGFEQNKVLRQAALKALAALKANAQDALPALAKFITRNTNQEDLLLAVGAIRSIVKDPSVKCDKILIDNLIELFQRDLIRDDIVESMNNFLEFNGKKRGSVSNAVIDTLLEMGPRALPALREYLNSKRNRARPAVDALQIMGSVEAIIAIASMGGFVIDREVQTKLTATLDAVQKNHKVQMKTLKAIPVPKGQESKAQAELEVFERMILRIDEALLLVRKAAVKKD